MPQSLLKNLLYISSSYTSSASASSCLSLYSMSSSSYSGSVSKSLSKISSLPANLTIFRATFICQCIVCMRIGWRWCWCCWQKWEIRWWRWLWWRSIWWWRWLWWRISWWRRLNCGLLYLSISTFIQHNFCTPLLRSPSLPLWQVPGLTMILQDINVAMLQQTLQNQVHILQFHVAHAHMLDAFKAESVWPGCRSVFRFTICFVWSRIAPETLHVLSQDTPAYPCTIPLMHCLEGSKDQSNNITSMKTSTLVLFLPINSEPLYTLMGEHDSRHSSEFYVLTSKFRRLVLSTPLQIAHIILGLYRIFVNMRWVRPPMEISTYIIWFLEPSFLVINTSLVVINH